jgi:hypothetical protein
MKGKFIVPNFEIEERRFSRNSLVSKALQILVIEFGRD